MRNLRLLLVTTLTLGGAHARATDADQAPALPPGAVTAAPSTDSPQQAPPAPPTGVSAPPRAAQAAQPAGPAVVAPTAPPAATPPAVPAGHWVYTQQYGWLFMPYGPSYWYAPPTGTGQPVEYVYHPTRGWVWVSAPWIWGIGAWPWFGPVGPARYGWYEAGWWRAPARWHYRPLPAPGVVVYRGPRRRVIVR